MTRLQKHRSLYSLIIAVVVLVTALAAVFYARGFKPDIKNGRIGRTGLIVATSLPTGAEVYLDDRLTGATDTNITYLDPRSYKVRIQKDGYTTWEKNIEVIADLASEIKALLFPLAPQISPLTATGAANPSLSPDTTKIVYGTAGERGGLMDLTMNSAPFALGQSTHTVVKNQGAFDFSKASFLWSPDSKQVIATFKNEQGLVSANLLIDMDKNQQDIRDITASLNSTLESWQEEINTRAQTQAIAAPDSVKNATPGAVVASPSPVTPAIPPSQSPTILNYFPTGMMFSPDEDKILYKDKAGKYNVYDIKLKKLSQLPEFSDLINITWFPDSAHLLLLQKNQISIVETDGSNKMVVYSGRFEDSFAFLNPSGSRLILLTTLAQPDGTPTNLYAINLK